MPGLIQINGPFSVVTLVFIVQGLCKLDFMKCTHKEKINKIGKNCISNEHALKL